MKFLISYATALCILTAALFVLGPLLAHFHMLPAMAGFSLFLFSILMGVVCLITSLLSVKAKQVQTGVMLLSVGALPVILVSYSLATSGHHPRINDVSTDLTTPPILIDQRHPETPVVLSPETAMVVKEFYSDLSPIRTNLAPDVVFAIISDEVKTNNAWTIVKYDQVSMSIHGYEQSGLFQFIDDFTIRVSVTSVGETIIDMRSKSRNGKGDFGANARRIRGFLDILSSKL